METPSVAQGDQKEDVMVHTRTFQALVVAAVTIVAGAFVYALRPMVTDVTVVKQSDFETTEQLIAPPPFTRAPHAVPTPAPVAGARSLSVCNSMPPESSLRYGLNCPH